MLSTIPNSPMSAADAIPLDYSSTVIALFLTRYAIPVLLDYEPIEFSILHEYNKFIRFLDCARLINHTHKAYNKACNATPHALLVACSQDESFEHVPFALTRCAAINHNLNADNIYDLISGVRSTWRFPLLKCLLGGGAKGPNEPKTEGSGVGKSTMSISWPDMKRVEQFVEDVKEAEQEMGKA
jgi:hypothetical protein